MTVSAADRRIAQWLLVVAALVFAMVVVGGVTRLTESGLSMVRWEPVVGIIPPLNDAAWQAEFDHYKTFPEYQHVNRGMTLEEFKYIFWWEYSHRLLGRVIGLAYLLPFLYFLAKGYVQPGLRLRLWGLFILGGLQGALGWYMVKSGLIDRPDVSHYRLAAHLSLALVIFAALIWTALSLLRPPTGQGISAWGKDAGLRRLTWVLALALAAQIVLGAFVAGLNAGLSYNTWPLMDGRLVPTGLWMMEPWWINLLENRTTLQFLHRMTAYALVAFAIWLWLHAKPRHEKPVGLAAHFVMAAIVVQAILGIVTLLLVVPVFWGAVHQAWAVVVLFSFVYFLHTARRA
jgi:cytochrome c oxidase assembly protein subunit 15